MDQTLTQPHGANHTVHQPASPTISIALAVFNGGELLRYAIQSLLNQTFTDWELLILDDGSSDGSIELIQQFNDPRIRLLCDGQNRGLAARLNQAIDLATGHYFARMDHDDICHPERFARQLSYLQANPKVDLLATECITMNEASVINGRLPVAIEHAAICRRPWIGFYMPHPTWMGKLSWFRQHRYPEPAPYCAEDQELLLRTHAVSTFHTYPEALLAYRVRTHTPWKKLWRTRLSLCRVQTTYFHQHHQWPQAGLSVTAMMLRLSSDLLRKLRQRFSSPAKPNAVQTNAVEILGPALAAQWQQILQDCITGPSTKPLHQERSVD